MVKHRLRILVFLQSSIKMTLDEFHQSLTATDPPAELTHALAGLWWDGKGDWKRAHEAAQQDEGIEGSWVHAAIENLHYIPTRSETIARPRAKDHILFWCRYIYTH